MCPSCVLSSLMLLPKLRREGASVSASAVPVLPGLIQLGQQKFCERRTTTSLLVLKENAKRKKSCQRYYNHRQSIHSFSRVDQFTNLLYVRIKVLQKNSNNNSGI